MNDTAAEYPSRYSPPAPVLRWLLYLLILAALAVSSLLLTQAMTGSGLPGCGPQLLMDCDSVLSSRWAKVLGVPVSLPAIVMYLSLLSLLVISQTTNRMSTRRHAWRAIVVIDAAIVGAALWFVGLQFFMDTFCLYCLMAHGLGMVIATLLLFLSPHGRARILPDEPADPLMIPPGLFACLAGIGLLGTITLVTLQLVVAPPSHAMQVATGGVEDFDTGPGPDRSMSILAGKVRLRPAEFPMLGSTDAPHIVVYLYDYTCPNCRAMHDQFVDAIDKLHGQLSVVKLVVPLDHQCNPHVEKTSAMHEGACELAKLSIAVWLADRSQFEAFDAWLSQGDKPASPEVARAYAAQLVGEDALAKALTDPEVDKRIEANITLYTMAGGAVVPQFIMGRNIIFSRPDPDQLMALFKEHLGITP